MAVQPKKETTMTQQPLTPLDTIQIRYRISYLTFLRMKVWGRQYQLGPSVACHALLMQALEANGVSEDPAVLLGLEEKDGE